MNVLAELRSRFSLVLADLVDDPAPLALMILASQDPKFGDYQANCAMPLGKQLGQPPREIAQSIINQVDVSDLCQDLQIAGPGFINLRLRDEWIVNQLNSLKTDQRLGIQESDQPQTYVIDYSSPNVAKPMHVGHIRSTVIGDALCRTLKFLGHQVISDNHLGDWGTQFGMIIYGYKHFRDDAAYDHSPIEELSRLYKLVRRLIDFFEAQDRLPELRKSIGRQRASIDEKQPADDAKIDKKLKKTLRSLRDKLADLESQENNLCELVDQGEAEVAFCDLARQHPDIGTAVQHETAKLHAGDAENLRLWEQFLPHCRTDIQRIYDRLNIDFDVEYGESFYHDRLADVVDSLEKEGLSRESDGAICVFLDGFEAPMIVRKRDGAFLYATTDLATIAYRSETWNPSSILYVVDHRQSEHFDKLFAVARRWGFPNIEFQHISFGTVLGEDNKPYKTRSGDTVGLEGLLDEAERKAFEVVRENELAIDLNEEQRRHVAQVIGVAALKYSDLSHNRTSDYVFSYDKMLSLRGNTATYCQYAYARIQSIFARGNVDIDALRNQPIPILIERPAERFLALQLIRFAEGLSAVVEDYRPNQLTNYLFELANRFSTFFEDCPVLKADTEPQQQSRLLLCDITARTLKQGLSLLGIQVVDRM